MAGLAFGGAKRAEIVFANQQLAGSVHALSIQWPVAISGAIAPQRRALRAVQDQVAIAPRLRRKAGVKIVRHRAGPVQAQIGWQMGIAAKHPGAWRALRLGVEVHHLAETMHAGIGASGTDHAHRMIGDPRQRPLQTGLHRAYTRALSLPTAKAAAVILHADRHAHSSSPNENPPVETGGSHARTNGSGAVAAARRFRG